MNAETIVWTGHPANTEVSISDLVPADICRVLGPDTETSVEPIACDPDVMGRLDALLPTVSTRHRLITGDARTSLRDISEDSIQMALTSPPYWTLKRYEDAPHQLGHVQDYEEFLCSLDEVWSGVRRVLVPGGHLIIVIGDVLLSRKQHVRHQSIPLHSSILVRCHALGFDPLATIIWHKIANAAHESGSGPGFLGKPYQPNAIVKNNIEYILCLRKPGDRLDPGHEVRALSVISADLYEQILEPIWRLGGASSVDHPAPYPVELAERLIRLYSYAGDTILDPFLGSGTTSVAAAKLGRHSVGIDVADPYVQLAVSRLEQARRPQGRLML